MISLSLFFLSKSGTTIALNSSELALLLFGIVLTIGLVGEYKTQAHSPRMKIFEMLVIVGVLGELLGDAGVFLFSNQLQVISDAEIREANRHALDARNSAINAAGDAKRAKDAADELEQRLLEQGPRNLLLYGKREQGFVNALIQFKGRRVQIRKCQFNDNEVRDTAERLTAVFKSARWNVSPHSPNWGESNCGITKPNEPIPSGIWVGTPNPHATPETKELARKVVGFLGQISLGATLHSVRPDTGRASESRTTIQGRYDSPDSIVVVVLEHPSSRERQRTSTGIFPIAGQ